MKQGWTVFLLCVVSVAVLQAAPGPVRTEQFHPEGSEYSFYRCELDLGGDMFWEVADLFGSGAERLYLVAPIEEQSLPQGRRMRAVMREKHIQRGRYPVSQFGWMCSEYASRHEGRGPTLLEDLDDEIFKTQREQLNRSPWEGVPGIAVDPPYVFLIPDVRFVFSGPQSNHVQRADRNLLAVELRPFVDDGKHRVTYTDHRVERIAIDLALVKQYDLQIHPVMPPDGGNASDTEDKPHLLLAMRKIGATKPLNISLTNSLSGELLSISWHTLDSPVSSAMAKDLLLAQQSLWMPYVVRSSGPVITSWAAHGSSQGTLRRGDRGRRSGGSTSAFGILGGRAAVRETLQMRGIGQDASDTSDRTISITNLQGVTVQSHPYEELLAGKSGGRLALAEVVPQDQFMLYVAKPAAILQVLDDGADFLSHLGSVLEGNSIKYDLPKRYLSRLGMNEIWLQNFLERNVVQEMAIVTPDLFFIDGTDVSVVSRVARPKMIGAMLNLIGVSGLSKGGVVSRKMNSGESSYWALRDDLLFVSTERRALDTLLELKTNAGAGSLGKSAEFRYMLTQLSPTIDTRIFAYLSDPFVRRLVGPQVKIAQLRRMTARSEMEFITAMAMLRRLNGKPSTTIAALIQEKYIPEAFGKRDYRLDDDLRVHSVAYGTLAQMATFSELPVRKVSPQEVKLYKTYVESYSRFWRRFFDPIVLRLDDMPDKSLNLTTFILPLVDNSIYNMLRETLHSMEDNQPLKNPVLSPSPLLKVSLNLKEFAWTEISKGMYEIFEDYAHINPAILDDLGPGFHLAIHDADPVVALGSGEFFGAFGASMTMRNNEVMIIPTLLSVLTRPCTIVIETQDPLRTKRLLSQAAATIPIARRRSGWFGVDLHQVSGRDEWIFTLDLENVIKLRYGLQMEGSFLLIRNIPWSSLDRIERVHVSDLNAARIDAYPRACIKQLPGLHAAATDGVRASAAESMGHIYPFLLSGVATLDNVEQISQRLFGFYPVHPGSGQWIWNGNTLRSTTFGSIQRQSSPPYHKDDPTFGALKDIATLNVSMQFENSGLRTQVRWKLK